MTPVTSPAGSNASSTTASALLSAVGATLGRPLDVDDIDVPLSILGADSLAMIELTAAMQDVLGVAPPPEFQHESLTIRELAAWLDSQPRGAVERDIARDPFEQMFADSVLPDDVRPIGQGPEKGLPERPSDPDHWRDRLPRRPARRGPAGAHGRPPLLRGAPRP
jgi:acyl carrier protein